MLHEVPNVKEKKMIKIRKSSKETRDKKLGFGLVLVPSETNNYLNTFTNIKLFYTTRFILLFHLFIFVNIVLCLLV